MADQPDPAAMSNKSMSSVPRGVWIGGGMLAVVTAGLAGALVTRSVDSSVPSEPSTLAAATSSQSLALTPTPATTQPTNRLTVAPSTSPLPVPRLAQAEPTRAALCRVCGVVDSVSAVRQNGQGSGLGAVAGGLLGGVVGHQAGGGNGKTALTVLGAIGGGLAGNEVEKRARAETLFDIQVRMNDGSYRSFQRAQPMAVGTQVVVEEPRCAPPKTTSLLRPSRLRLHD